jgi:Protein of unknown function (DUF732)
MTEGQVLAWRVFTVDGSGTLLAPFAMRFGERLPGEEWRTTVTIASCITDDHEAPAEGCYCGLRGVQDLDQLLARFDEGKTAAVVARVRLSGRMLPGVDVPDDDPESTLRAERAELVEIHCAPPLTSRSGAVADRYPSVPVFSYAAPDWPNGITDPASGSRVRPVGTSFPADVRETGEAAFAAEVRRAGFGDRDLEDADDAAIVALGHTVCDGLRKGISGEDAASVYFSHPSRPTLAQVRTLINSALTHLCPECTFMFRETGYVHSEPIRLPDALNRMMTDVGRRAMWAADARRRRA